MKNIALFPLVVLLFSSWAIAAAPKVGKAAAARYFQNERKYASRGPSSETADESSSSRVRPGDHYMSFGFGTFSESTAYNWGQNGREEKVGNWAADISYRLTEGDYQYDELIKISYAQYKPANQEASKLSFMYALNFPEAGSKFPLYFGAAAGLGVYMKQIEGESSLTGDYQLYIGARIFNVFDSVGIYVEGGLRNHLHITSDGQFNGTFLSLGTVFTF